MTRSESEENDMWPPTSTDTGAPVPRITTRSGTDLAGVQGTHTLRIPTRSRAHGFVGA